MPRPRRLPERLNANQPTNQPTNQAHTHTHTFTYLLNLLGCVQDGVEPNAVVYEHVEEACRVGGRLDKIVGLKWKRLTTG